MGRSTSLTIAIESICKSGENVMRNIIEEVLAMTMSAMTLIADRPSNRLGISIRLDDCVSDRKIDFRQD
jgi:hypothetical protein